MCDVCNFMSSLSLNQEVYAMSTNRASVCKHLVKTGTLTNFCSYKYVVKTIDMYR